MLQYVVAFLQGFGLATAIAIIFIKKISDKKKKNFKEFAKELNKVKVAIEKMSSVQDRLSKVQEITKDQLDMQLDIDRPQMNSLDGKYKNSLSRKVKAMEEEKRDILQSILDDGFDPEITALNSDSISEKMKLSEFMSKNFESVKTDKPNSKPSLRLVKNTESEDPTV